VPQEAKKVTLGVRQPILLVIGALLSLERLTRGQVCLHAISDVVKGADNAANGRVRDSIDRDHGHPAPTAVMMKQAHFASRWHPGMGRGCLEHGASARQIIRVVKGDDILPQDLFRCVAEPLEDDRVGKSTEMVFRQDQDDIRGMRNQRPCHPFSPRQ
jgi:hypothetical protein